MIKWFFVVLIFIFRMVGGNNGEIDFGVVLFRMFLFNFLGGKSIWFG